MKLHHTITGPQDGLPILLVHGLFGQGRNLGAVARRLADHRPVVTVDLRNHGDSPHDARMDYPTMAADLASLIGDLGGRVDLAGHSMGGKAAMMLALTQPQLLRKLVVMDIAPVAYTHSQLRLVDAMQALTLDGLDRRSVADARLSETVGDPGVRAFLLQSLDLKAMPPQWRLNLPVLHDAMPDLMDWPNDTPKATFDGPVLVIGGEMSDYIDADGEQALRAAFPQARVIRLKRAGHWLHADAPEAVADTLAAFFGHD